MENGRWGPKMENGVLERENGKWGVRKEAANYAG